MQGLTSHERNKLKAVGDFISSFKLQLVENGLTSQQISSYFHHVIIDHFYTPQINSSNDNLNQTITSILMNQNGNLLKTLKKLQIAFYLQRSQLHNSDSEETIQRKQSDIINEKIIQKKNGIKEQRKKQTKQEKKNGRKDASENIQIENSQSQKLKPLINIDVQSFKGKNPLKESTNVFPNIIASNEFSNMNPQPQIKNLFVSSRQIEGREELSKNLFEINVLKQILKKKTSSRFEEEEQNIEQNDDVHEFLDLSA